MRDSSVEDALREEISQLRAQVAGLTQDVARLERWRLWAQTALNILPTLVYVRDTDFKFVLMNDAFAAFLSLPREQAEGMADVDVFPPETIEHIRIVDRRVLFAGEKFEAEETVPLADGPRTYITRKHPVIGPGGDAVAIAGAARHKRVVMTGAPLVRAAKAVQLLGATTILTGIGPDVARTLTDLNVDLSGVVTRGTLQSGVADALARRSRGRLS